MLEQLDLSQSVSKADYERRLPDLQRRLYDLDTPCSGRTMPVALVFEGWAAAGKGTTLNTLADRLDPRGFRVAPIAPAAHASRCPTPGCGASGSNPAPTARWSVYDTSWYRRVLIDRITGAGEATASGKPPTTTSATSSRSWPTTAPSS